MNLRRSRTSILTAIVRRSRGGCSQQSLRAECGHKADYSFVTFAGDDYLEKYLPRVATWQKNKEPFTSEEIL